MADATSKIDVAGPQKMFFSVDGAMVPLVGGEWAEVKTLTIGEIEKPVLEQGEWVVHSREHSYFSRKAEANDFRRLALVETHQWGVEKAETIAAVMDGAEWQQGFVDFHCPTAVRILDFPHAGERVSQIGQTLWGQDTPATQTWPTEPLHSLKHTGPETLLSELKLLEQQHPNPEIISKNLAYLEKRAEPMQYPLYRQKELPLGSGAMESGNKVVVEARLKGAWMHWAIPHVNPMLALRNMLCSDLWDEAWQQLTTVLRQQETQRRKALHLKHKAGAQPQSVQAVVKNLRLRVLPHFDGTAFQDLVDRNQEFMALFSDEGFEKVDWHPENLKIWRRGEWNSRMIVETVLSMLTLVDHFKKVMHRKWAYLKSRIAFTMAMFNILVEWDGIQVDEFGNVHFSLAPFSL